MNFIKKVISVFLIAAIISFVMPKKILYFLNKQVIVEASLTTDSSFSGGTGSKEDPYQITNPTQFNNIRNNMSAYYILNNDIDLSEYSNWVAIGDENAPFLGSLDGNGYKIKGLSIKSGTIGIDNAWNCAGLFGVAYNLKDSRQGAEFRNINLEDVLINIDSNRDYEHVLYVGALCATHASGNILKCHVSGKITVKNGFDVNCGGIIGFGYREEIASCISDIKIDIEALAKDDRDYNGHVNCGGISGYMGDILDCKNNGNINIVSGNFTYCGGILGSEGNIHHCENKGNITIVAPYSNLYVTDGANHRVGGIAGDPEEKVEYCINYGNVNVEIADKDCSASVGGITGMSAWNHPSYYYCFNLGNVSCNEDTGLIWGQNSNVIEADNCYSLKTATINGYLPQKSIGKSQANGELLSRTELLNKYNEALLLYNKGKSDGTDSGDNMDGDGTKGKYIISGKSNHYYGMNKNPDDENEKNLKKYIDDYASAYDKYMQKVNGAVDTIEKDGGINSSKYYTDQAKKLKEKNTVYLNYAGFDIYNGEADLAAYEALVRMMTEAGKNAGIDFSNINYNNADSAITNKICNWIKTNSVNQKYSLDTKVGNQKVSAECNLTFNMGTIIITQKKSGKQYRFSCVPSYGSAKTMVSQYVSALRDLEKGALDNIKYAVIKDILSTEIGQSIEKDVKKAFTNQVNTRLESAGIKNLADTVIKCNKYYNKVNGLYNAMTKINDKSIKEVAGFMLTENIEGDFASEAYKELCEKQKKLKEKLSEYVLTGTITREKEKNLFEKFTDWVAAKFFCPIEIEIYDESGKKVGFIGEDNIWAEEGIVVEKTGDSKIIYTPKVQSYTYKIKGTDDGQVSSVFESYTDGLPDGRVTYQNIEVEGGSVVDASVGADGKKVLIEMKNDQGIIQGNSIDGDEDAYVEISTKTETGGKTCGGGFYVKGDKATITALADEEYAFLGWYDSSGDLVTVKHDYSFIALENQTLTAKFLQRISSKDLEAANAVLDMIIGLDENAPDENKVKETKEVYEALTDEQKQMIDSDSLKILIESEKKIAARRELHGEIVQQGQCGENAYWKLYEDGELIISGKGGMWDYQYSSEEHKMNPWRKNESVKKIVVEEGITYIGERAFTYCNYAEEIQLPKSVKKIGRFACSRCEKLQTVNIPDGVEELNETFSSCESLSEINLPDSLKKIGDNTFAGCNITSIDIPKNVISIGENALGGRLKEIIIPKSVTTLEEKAFWCCEPLETVKIEGTIENINKGVFAYCQNLKNISIKEGAKTIGEQAFYECTSLEKIKLPDSIIQIDKNAFGKCSSLKEVKLPADLQTMESGVFWQCTGLEEIEIPKNVDLIKQGAYGLCTNIKTVTINGAETRLEDDIFYTRQEGGEIKGGKWVYYYEGDMVIKAAKGSPAEQYAAKYGIRFEEFHSEHQWDAGKVTKEATCTEEGVKTYTCEICKEIKTEAIKAIGHKPVIDTAVVPSETTTGLTEGSHCAVCGKILKKQELIPEKGPKTTLDTIKVKKLSLSGISKQIAAGKKLNLTATILPENAANKKLKWSTSNKKIATVSQNGVVTIKKKTGGKSVTITAMATDGSGKKAFWKIKVMKGVVKKINVKGAKKTLKAGKSMKLTTTVKGTKGANKKLQWTSSNKKWATVSSKGVVKALKAGKGRTVKITVTSTDGTNVKKTMAIKIK